MKASLQNKGINITLDTVRRANSQCIKDSKQARRLGISLNEYMTLQDRNGEFDIRIGTKTYNSLKIAKKVLSDKEKLNAASKAAWEEHVKPFLKENLDRVMSIIRQKKS